MESNKEISQQAVNQYYNRAYDNEGNKTFRWPGLKGKERLVIVEKKNGDKVLECRKLTRSEKKQAAQGKENAAYKNVIEFCQKQGITHSHMPKDIEVYNKKYRANQNKNVSDVVTKKLKNSFPSVKKEERSPEEPKLSMHRRDVTSEKAAGEAPQHIVAKDVSAPSKSGEQKVNINPLTLAAESKNADNFMKLMRSMNAEQLKSIPEKEKVEILSFVATIKYELPSLLQHNEYKILGNEVTSKNTTVLEEIVKAGRYSAAVTLLENVPKGSMQSEAVRNLFKLTDESGMTLFHMAAANHNYDFLTRYLEYMDKDALGVQSTNGKTILHHLIENGNLENSKMSKLVSTLIEKGASTSIQDNTQPIPLTPLTTCDLNGLSFVHIYLAKDEVDKLQGVAWKDLTFKKLPLAYYMAQQGNIKGLEQLKKEDLDLKKEPEGNTALHYAIENGKTDIAKKLIELGANVTKPDSNNRTPLAIAFKMKNKELIDILINKEINLELKETTEGFTLLHYAVAYGDKDIIKQLIKKGMNLNDAKNVYGETPLHEAVKYKTNNGDFIASLIEQGAEVNSRGESQNTPLHIAAMRSSEDVIEALITRGADVNAKDYRGMTPLHNALLYSDNIHGPQVMKKLLDNGADPFLKADIDGEEKNLLDSLNERREISLDKACILIQYCRDKKIDIPIQDFGFIKRAMNEFERRAKDQSKMTKSE